MDGSGRDVNKLGTIHDNSVSEILNNMDVSRQG